MILADVRIVADGLNSFTFGVNKQLEQLPIDDKDKRPPPVKAVLDITRSNRAALVQQTADQVGPEWPVIIVLADEPTTWDGEVATSKRDGTCPIFALYVTREPDPAKAICDAAYTLRAMVRAVRDLLALDPNDAQRKHLGICLVSVRDLEAGLVGTKLKDGSVIAGGTGMTCFTRDTQP